MKRLLSTLTFCSLIFISKAQVSEVEKSIFGIQIGTFGVWIHNEAKLTNSMVLRSELGLSSGFGFGSGSNDYFFMTPVISIEPRWYYNLTKRNSKGKNTLLNSGNFLAVDIGYSPDWIILSSSEDVNSDNVFYLVPTWGLRRNIGKKFNYEFGAGIGYAYIFDNNGNGKSDIAYNLHLRIGYIL